MACLWLAQRLARPATRLTHALAPAVVGTRLIAGVAAVCGVVVFGGPGLMLGAVPYGVEWRRARRAAAKHERELGAALPSLADLLAVAVTAGYGPSSAIERVTPHVSPVLEPYLNSLAVKVARGAALRDELRVLGQALGRPAEPLLRVLEVSLDDGVGSATALRAAAADLRLGHRRTREAEIAALPIRLLFPLVVCILPAFVLLTLVPVLIGSLRDVSTAL